MRSVSDKDLNQTGCWGHYSMGKRVLSARLARAFHCNFNPPQAVKMLIVRQILSCTKFKVGIYDHRVIQLAAV